jgi:hypothetical protein
MSILSGDLIRGLDPLEKNTPRQIDHLRRVTLAGPNTYRCVVQFHVDILLQRIPNLEGVGFQSQNPNLALGALVPPFRRHGGRSRCFKAMEHTGMDAKFRSISHDSAGGDCVVQASPLA